MSASIEDCIAMSEDGDWYAFPASWKRSEVISAVAEHTENGWRDALRRFRFRKGHVRPWTTNEDDFDFGEEGWFYPCQASHPDAQPAWIASERW